MEYPGAVGLGTQGKPDLWLMQTEHAVNPTMSRSAPPPRSHRRVPRRGPRRRRHRQRTAGAARRLPPTYYAAFVRDPEGNNIEVVCHAPPQAPRTAKAARPAAKGKAKARKKIAAKRPAKTKTKPSETEEEETVGWRGARAARCRSDEKQADDQVADADRAQ